jgi:hypothetical protein
MASPSCALTVVVEIDHDAKIAAVSATARLDILVAATAGARRARRPIPLIHILLACGASGSRGVSSDGHPADDATMPALPFPRPRRKDESVGYGSVRSGNVGANGVTFVAADAARGQLRLILSALPASVSSTTNCKNRRLRCEASKSADASIRCTFVRIASGAQAIP